MKPCRIFLAVSGICALLCLFPTTRYGNQNSRPPQRKYKVDVPVVKVIVRVFENGKPVGGLKKEAFQLTVNSTPKAIHVFYQERLKISPLHPQSRAKRLDEDKDSGERAGRNPNLFLLMFNICNAHLQTKSILDILFSRIIHKGDRLMVITNRDFLDDFTVYNVQASKETIQDMLEQERMYVKKMNKNFKLTIQSMLRRFKAGMKYSLFQEQKREDFILEYRQLARRYKTLLTVMTENRYLQLAEHLKNQDCGKWVLNFYQKGKFYQPKLNSQFRTDLFGPDFMESNMRYLELQEVFEKENKIPIRELSRLFAGTGASFHSLLMESRNSMQNYLSPDLSWSAVDSDSYQLLLKIAERTGGTFMHSNDIKTFLKRTEQFEDIRYVIGYHPGNDEIGALKITHKNKKYRLLWD